MPSIGLSGITIGLSCGISTLGRVNISFLFVVLPCASVQYTYMPNLEALGNSL